MNFGMRIAERGVFNCRKMSPRQDAEGLSRTDLQEDSFRVVQQFVQAIGKKDGLAQVLHPVAWIGRFLLCDPSAADIGEEGDPRWPEINLSDRLQKMGKDRLHHVGMEGMG